LLINSLAKTDRKVQALSKHQRAIIERRVQIAREFVQQYARENPNVIGAILVGSTNIGITDKYADLDIIVIASLGAVSKRKAEGKGYNETYSHNEVEICVDWHSIPELQGELENWQNDASLWSLSHGKILLDTHYEVEKLLKTIKPYPFEIRKKKLFLHFYWLSYYLDIVETSIEREEHETAASHVYSSVAEICQILFLLENKFVPIEKWRFHEIKRLSLGGDMLSMLRESMCIAKLDSQELEVKLAILTRICRKLKPRLLASGLERAKIGKEWWKFEPDWSVAK